MAETTSEKAPDFDLAVTDEERIRLSDFLGRSNLLLVFHPFAFTPVCEEEARDLQENIDSFRNAQTEIVLVSCDPWPARRAWKEQIGADYTFASDFWPHGEAAKAYDVFNERNGAPHRGTFLIDKEGQIIWSYLSPDDERRTAMVPDSLETLHETV
jgi:mycoredoxin-dependent peroxiredoxin